MNVSALHLGLFLFPSSLFAVVTTPFTENFNSYSPGDTLPPNFSEGSTAGDNNASITIVNTAPGNNGYQFAVGSSTSRFSTVQTQGVVGGNFSTSIQFTLSSFSGTGTENAGFVFLSTADVNTAYRLTYNVGSSGTFPGRINLSRFVSGTGSNGTLSGNGGNYFIEGFTPSLTSLYTLTVNGTYNAGQLSLETIFSDGTTTKSFTVTDSSPLTGEYFGARAATSGTGTGVTVIYDNFSIIPEPSNAALLGIGGLALLRRRR